MILGSCFYILYLFVLCSFTAKAYFVSLYHKNIVIASDVKAEIKKKRGNLLPYFKSQKSKRHPEFISGFSGDYLSLDPNLKLG